MTKEEKRQDWLNWFRLAVTQAKDARRSGEIERALHLDSVVEQYYRDALDLGYYAEDYLFEIESEIRG